MALEPQGASGEVPLVWQDLANTIELLLRTRLHLMDNPFAECIRGKNLSAPRLK